MRTIYLYLISRNQFVRESESRHQSAFFQPENGRKRPGEKYAFHNRKRNEYLSIRSLKTEYFYIDNMYLDSCWGNTGFGSYLGHIQGFRILHLNPDSRNSKSRVPAQRSDGVKKYSEIKQQRQRFNISTFSFAIHENAQSPLAFTQGMVSMADMSSCLKLV